MADDQFLQARLDERKAEGTLRSLRLPDRMVDFCSNDYLGLASRTQQEDPGSAWARGSRGSRLLAGNYPLIEQAEREIARFHEAEAGLIFNSGYDGNTGLFSSVPRKGDTVLYDQLIHASVRDGIRLSGAHAFSFQHNSVEDLEKKLEAATGQVFVAVETLYSMDGDIPPLQGIEGLCRKKGAHLVVDEAHATGICGPRGEGLVQAEGLQSRCFARLHTFGKALGAQGAIILGSSRLRDYLINFSRPFIYTTALAPASIAAIRSAYQLFPAMDTERRMLTQLAHQLQEFRETLGLLPGQTPIQILPISGQDKVKDLASRLQAGGLDVRPILHPTVPRGGERLRIVLHSFNTPGEVSRLTEMLSAC